MIHKKILLLLILVLFIWRAIFAERWQHLKKIDKIHISIVNLSEDARRLGLSKKMLRTITESRLRKEGLKPIDDFDLIKLTKKSSKFPPSLKVEVSIKSSAFHVSLNVEEPVKLIRKPSYSLIATIWHTDLTGLHGQNSEYIISSFKTLLDEFFSDYYRANPRKKKK